MSNIIGGRRYLTNFDVNRLTHTFTDVIVIGAGVAGLRAALAASESAEVLLIAKDSVDNCATSYAQGGVAAAVGEDDTCDSHIDDTLRVGCGVADDDIVRHVVNAAPAQIKQLQDWGADFDLVGERLALGREGGHSAARVIHANGDSTGREIMRVLVDQARKNPRIRIFEKCFVIDLLTKDSRAVGVVTYHQKYGHQMFWAPTTIIAAGGLGRIYRETTNPSVATGDGVAIAFRAGALLRDLELVQFHPTTLYVAGAARALVSEAVRGEGAYLTHRDGERFMHNYDERAELASRDIVSRAISQEMRKHGTSCVYLDARHFAEGLFAKRFPNISRLCREFDIEPEKDLIPVRPSAHYSIGGVAVDRDTRTSLDGLLACGEAACSGLNGANRLASNSLLEGLVYGERAGRLAAERALANDKIDHPLPLGHLAPQSPRTALDVQDVMHSLQSVMSRNAAVERTADRLRETSEIIEFWSRYVMDKVFDTPGEWETQNMLTAAMCIVHCAAARCESRGVHYRSDFPLTDDERWRSHIDVRRAEYGVHLTNTPLPGASMPT